MSQKETGLIPNIFNGVSEISDNFVKQKFGDVGDLIQEYACALVGFGPLQHQGNMYITERKIRIPFNMVTNIARHNTAFLFANGISISTNDKTYVFKGFWNREDAYLKLASLLQEARPAAHPHSPQVRHVEPPKQITTPL